jgi:Tautomerase enzyme
LGLNAHNNRLKSTTTPRIVPFVRIFLRASRSQEFKQPLGDCFCRAMHETMNVPSGDRFQVITEHDASGLIYEPDYLDVPRTEGIIFVQGYTEHRTDAGDNSCLL